MKIILNFDTRELSVQNKCNFVELNKHLKKLLGDDLKNWDIIGTETQWIYQWWPTVIYTEYPNRITYSVGDNTWLYGSDVHTESIVCFTNTTEDAG